MATMCCRSHDSNSIYNNFNHQSIMKIYLPIFHYSFCGMDMDYISQTAFTSRIDACEQSKLMWDAIKREHDVLDRIEIRNVYIDTL